MINPSKPSVLHDGQTYIPYKLNLITGDLTSDLIILLRGFVPPEKEPDYNAPEYIKIGDLDIRKKYKAVFKGKPNRWEIFHAEDGWLESNWSLCKNIKVPRRFLKRIIAYQVGEKLNPTTT